MVMMSDSEENLQILINRAKQFFDFANVKLNPNKCEVMTINPERNDKGIVINDVEKEYITGNSFIKYLGVPLGSRKL
jgi:hypothetical protein